jgi:hypothetical protein
MTTAAQVKQVTGPLLERNSDLALVGRLVVVKPVHHIIRGIYIDRSLDPRTFTPTWFVCLLFPRDARVGFGWGDRLYNQAHGPWDVANAKTPAVMCEEIEQYALPPLRAIQSIDDYVAFISQKERFPHTYVSSDSPRMLIIHIARGDFDAARAICAWRVGRPATSTAESAHELCSLLAADDRPGLVNLLHTWEADSVKRLKLEKFWEPTPFPLELQGAGATASSQAN